MEKSVGHCSLQSVADIPAAINHTSVGRRRLLRPTATTREEGYSASPAVTRSVPLLLLPVYPRRFPEPRPFLNLLLPRYSVKGGFDMICRGRNKIETPEQLAFFQFKQAESQKNKLDLDGRLVIGGDDSNTNACLLGECFRLAAKTLSHSFESPRGFYLVGVDAWEINFFDRSTML